MSPLFGGSWSSSSKMNMFGKMGCDEMVGDAVIGGGGSHCSTVERLYAWEKKLYQEVKVRIIDVNLVPLLLSGWF